MTTNSESPNKQQAPSSIRLEDAVAPATRLLEKRRMMYEVHDALEAQKAK
jgi:hypothetical protein